MHTEHLFDFLKKIFTPNTSFCYGVKHAVDAFLENLKETKRNNKQKTDETVLTSLYVRNTVS